MGGREGIVRGDGRQRGDKVVFEGIRLGDRRSMSGKRTGEREMV